VGKENSEGILSFVRNISAGGLLFHSKQNIPQESTIELDIAINFPPREEPIKVLAKVQRAKFLKKVGGYDIGIKFINLDTHTRDLINNRIINSSK
jgi:c-di-GMP-binding flagellar brake protein YcgR